MIQSRPITAHGRMLGVATTADQGWTFIATDPSVEDLHGVRFHSPAEAERVALLVLDRDHRPRPAPGGRAA